MLACIAARVATFALADTRLKLCRIAGLGLFEYMQLAEDLGAEPVWVINNGVSHEESVPAGHIESWVQDALDSIECAAP